MKKILAIWLCTVMALSLIACGKENGVLNPTSDATFDRTETTDDNSNSDESFFNNENVGIRINSKNSAQIEIVISDENVAAFYELSKNDQYSNAQFYVKFFTIENEEWNTYASIQVYPQYASFTSAEHINEEYDSNNELISAEPLWGYSTDSQGALAITENELIVTFKGPDIAKKLDVDGLYYQMGYWADSFLVLGEGSVAQILSDVDVDLAEYPVEFTINARGEYECRVRQEGIEKLLSDGVEIRLYADSEEFAGDYGYMFISVYLNNPETMSYIGHMGYRELKSDGSYEEIVFEKTYGTGNDSYSESIDFPKNIQDGYIAIRCNDKAANEMFSQKKYYSVFSVESNVIPGGLIADAMKSSVSENEMTGKYQLVADYTKPTDGDFFRPVTEYYRVYELSFPVAIVGDWDWYLWEDDFGAPGPNPPYNAYGPCHPRESSCTVTYLESVDEFGKLLQYAARVSFENEDDVLLAWADIRHPFFPYAYTGVDDMSLEAFPDDFVHNNMMMLLDCLELAEALCYYEEGSAYFDLLDLLKAKDDIFDDYHLIDNFRAAVNLPCVMGIGEDMYQIVDRDYLDELDANGKIDATFEYYMLANFEDGFCYPTKNLHGTFKGYTLIDSYREE